MRFEKIVNYKNALAANVVGILEFLRKKYDNVYFILENLNISDVARQSQQQAQAVHRQLEWLLLNKLRKKDLVPSDISKQIIFREQKGDRQLGVVLFLKEERTSTLCPYCETERMGYSKEEFKNAKFQQRQIRCKKCGSSFHPDEIACINLAKKGFNFFRKELV
jgi:transposase